MTRGRAIASAIVRRAKMRTALENLARDLNGRLALVVAAALRAATRIFRNAAGFRRVYLVLGREPVAGPFPNIADHVVHPIAVWRKRRYRRCAPEAGLALVRKVAMPGVRHRAALGHELIAPGELCILQPAARGEFPFGFGRKILSGPARVQKCIRISDVHHRMVVEALDITVRAVGMLPVCPLEKCPPLAPVAQIDRMLWWREHQRTREQHVRARARIVL